MKDIFNKSNKQKNLFKSYYCGGCRQRKPCQFLTGWDSVWKSYCCVCFYQREEERAKEYSDYQQVYQSKLRERQEYIQQYQLLKSYQGCKKCSSKEVDTYSLYQESKLVCQPCLMKKEDGSSSPISFLEQEKWFKRYWKIDLAKWLEIYGCLPVNKNCADKWKLDNKHLGNCNCLEVEAKETYELFANSLRKIAEKLKDCKCEVSNKPRTPYYDSDNYGYAYCEKCETRIAGAGKHGVIKNRNDPKFWGLEVKEKVLCGNCLESKKEKMSSLRKAEFNRYRKVGRL